MTRFSPAAVPQTTVTFGSIQVGQDGHLATDRTTGTILFLQQTGPLYVVNPTTLQGTALGDLAQTPIDGTRIYDVLTGTVRDGSGFVVPGLARFGDLAMHTSAGGTRPDVFVSVRGSTTMFLAVWSLIYAGELGKAERHSERAIHNARERGLEGEVFSVSGSYGQVLLRQGRLAEAEAIAHSALASTATPRIAQAMLQSCLMATIVERTDPGDWQPFLTAHDLDGDLSSRVMGGMLLFFRGHLRLAAGDPRAALEDFEALHGRDERSGLHTPAIPSSAPRALAHLALGDRDAARVLAGDELDQARRWGAPGPLAYALRTAGLVEGGGRGIELLRDAVAAASPPASSSAKRSRRALVARTHRPEPCDPTCVRAASG